MSPYLPYASQEKGLRDMLAGVARTMADQVLSDPFSNAFLFGNATSPWGSDYRVPPVGKGVWEGKYEADTLASFLSFSAALYNATGDLGPFRGVNFSSAVAAALTVLETMQRSTAEDFPPSYKFLRSTTTPTDTLMHATGPPCAATGMVRTAFRPSDDAATLPFNVPVNFFLEAALTDVAVLLLALGDPASVALAHRAELIATGITYGLDKYAVTVVPGAGEIFPYEVDGFGNVFTMDDAGMPSLLGLPLYARFFRSSGNPAPSVALRERYERTRAYVLSSQNPYYFKGSYNGTSLTGVGSPHTGFGSVWPMGQVTQALTSSDESEIAALLRALLVGSNGTGFIHESLDPSNPSSFTRPWFAWANAYFGSLVLSIMNAKPHLLEKHGQ
jgi:meiotically up-regulated gene 157 (Mug157) protein